MGCNSNDIRGIIPLLLHPATTVNYSLIQIITKMKTEGNSPANPYDGSGHTDTTGLTKREHFAALAMQGYVVEGTSGIELKSLAQWSVSMADELINALNEPKK